MQRNEGGYSRAVGHLVLPHRGLRAEAI